MSALREGRPFERAGVRIWRHAGRELGASAISLRVIEVARGVSPGLRSPGCDEVLYVLDGHGTLYLDGWPYDVAPETGVYVPPGACLTVHNPGPGALTLAGSQCPDPGPEPVFEAPCTTPPPGAAPRTPAPIVRLRDQPAETTADRWYRALVDHKLGSAQVTQFVGAIPPGRAPDHYHHYEEVLVVLVGEGRMWARRSHAPLAPGSCVYLPRGQPHCVENTGRGELRLLGVFYPAGSPAVRYPA